LKRALNAAIILILISYTIVTVNAQTEFQFIGSKQSDVYHYPSCFYVSNIKEENKVFFEDAQDAVDQGYHPCSICDPPLPSSNPSPTVNPTPASSPTPTVTPTPSPASTINPSSTTNLTASPSTNVSPSPSSIISEFNPAIAMIALALISGAILIAKKKATQ
jgi:hypothetical protein